jgi:hypothetical protein
MMNEQLLKKIKRAAEKGIGPADIEEYVGRHATLNTRQPKRREALELADIGPDLRYTTKLPNLKSAVDVVYWSIDESDGGISVTGLAWFDDGKIEVFYGIVYLP